MEARLTSLSEKLGCESTHLGLGECEPIHEDAGMLCYMARRFQAKALVSNDPDKKASGRQSELYEVRIIDNDYNTYQQVMDVSMLALGLSEDEAFPIAWEVDHKGYCVVAQGPYDEAEAIAGTIRTIGIEVQVNLVEAQDN